MAASADSEFPSKRSSAAAAATAASLGGNRGARRSLANDLYNERHHHQYQQQQQLQLPLEAYSPRLFTKKHLLLLQQQQRQYQFVEDQHHRQPQPNLLNSRRVYPSSSSRNHQFLRNGAGDLSSTDCSNHGSPLMPRKVPKKMVVDEKQLALKILRARNALACSSSSTSSSSSSSENASLRASIESGELPHRLSAAELARRSLLSGCVSKSLMNTAMHQKLIASSGSRNRSENESAANVHEKKVSCVAAAAGSSGRNSDAEDCVRLVMNRDFRQQLQQQQQQQRAVGPVLLRSASCSSANSSALTKLVRLKAADMALGMQEHAFYCANEVLDGMDKLHCKRVAWVLKKEFDKAYGPAWHCVVGTSFGSYVTHSVGGFLYFSIGKVSVLLFQTAVELIEHH